MKTFKVDIAPGLKNVDITVKNGAEFQRCITKGQYRIFTFMVNNEDAIRIKKFVIKTASSKDSGKGNWFAHCNGFNMDLLVTNAGKCFQLNTYRPYGKTKEQII